jgi:uncharacterized phage-associated protein
MLEEARRPVTNLALQKLLYFAHGLHLIGQKKPLVSGYFEAWQHGPVHPAAYRAFKSAEAKTIDFRADAVDALTGVRRPLAAPSDSSVTETVRRVMSLFGDLTASQLRDISHAPRGPWDNVVKRGRAGVALGLRIPNPLIVELFKHHKVAIGDRGEEAGPHEDAPFDF